MPLPTVTPLPAPPNRATQSGDTFSDAADTFLTALQPFADEFNELAEAIVVANAAANYNSESTTSLAIGTGTKSPAALRREPRHHQRHHRRWDRRHRV